MTQEGLAEMIGIHWKTLGYIESGKRDFGVSTLVKLIFRLKIPSEQLLEGVSVQAPENIGIIIKAVARRRKPRKRS